MATPLPHESTLTCELWRLLRPRSRPLDPLVRRIFAKAKQHLAEQEEKHNQ